MARAQFWTQIFKNHVNVGYCGIPPKPSILQPLPKYYAGACAGFGKGGV